MTVNTRLYSISCSWEMLHVVPTLRGIPLLPPLELEVPKLRFMVLVWEQCWAQCGDCLSMDAAVRRLFSTGYSVCVCLRVLGPSPPAPFTIRHVSIFIVYLAWWPWNVFKTAELLLNGAGPFYYCGAFQQWVHTVLCLNGTRTRPNKASARSLVLLLFILLPQLF
jgi:hypothetical protein